MAVLPPGLAPAPGVQLAQPAVREIVGYARAVKWGVPLFFEPNFKARRGFNMYADDLLPIFGEVNVEATPSHNKLWYEVEGGYVHSAFIHPTQWIENSPETDAGPDGFWAEVTVPFTDALIEPSLDARRTKYRYYFETTYKVEATRFSDGEWWYGIEDEVFPGNYWVRAKHLRRITPDELSVLSPDVDPRDKRLVVDVVNQRTTAFEGKTQVFEARCATGYKWDDKRDFRTAIGTFAVMRKTPSQHMSGGQPADDDYFDLPGIPWISYFTYSGVAFHGAYWHNDYGVMRSHGCINLTAQQAKWVYRWSLPVADSATRYTIANPIGSGTRVDVVGFYKN
jgi:hypothetical protein